MEIVNFFSLQKLFGGSIFVQHLTRSQGCRKVSTEGTMMLCSQCTWVHFGKILSNDNFMIFQSFPRFLQTFSKLEIKVFFAFVSIGGPKGL